MTIPMLENVPEKPAPITLARPLTVVPSYTVLSTIGIPAHMPETHGNIKLEKKG